MNKIFSLLYKDFLLLIRDRAGLALSFVMPMILVLIMTSIQDNTFKTIKESGIPLILLNNDHDSLGNSIEKALQKSEMFQVTNQTGSLKSAEENLKKSVASGKYWLGIIIPANATSRIKKSIKKNVNIAFSGIGKNSLRQPDSIELLIYLDPAIKSSFKNSIISSIRENTSKIQNQLVLKEISSEIRKRIPKQSFNFKNIETVSFKEEYALNYGSNIIPNSVQHNVPAWTLFAMFFIVISLAGNMINEREGGSFVRLLIMPCSYLSYLTSKILIYTIVCLLQFTLIFSMGILIFPTLGLPSLEFGTNFMALFVIAFTSALAAIGFGIAIGTISTSHLQATTFGSVSVVILAAIGGIWVPVFAMPSFMRTISILSPMNWGLNGFYDIFIRDGNFISIIPESISLLVFFFICICITLLYNRLK